MTASGAVSVPEPCMFTYDVAMTQVVVVEAGVTNSSQQFDSKCLTVWHLVDSQLYVIMSCASHTNN